MKKHKLVILLFLFLLYPQVAFSQYYFGKNKIQYTAFDWQVFSTKHFDIYFYTEEKEMAEIAAGLAEDSYKLLASRFNHEIDKRIPLIIYSSPNYFVQTNVLPYLIPENVGGFFEFIKGRTVIPFNGSYSDFKRVIRHELVHVFTYAKLSYVLTAHRRHGYSVPPLWFIEGLAEHWSADWNSEAEMIMRDLVLSEKPIQISQVYEQADGFLMYKVGQSICEFLSETYGDGKLGLLLDDYWKVDNFREAIKLTYGKELKDIGKDWEYWLRKKYFPLVKDKEPVNKFTQQLTFNGFNLMPSVFKNTPNSSEDMVAFKSNRLGYSTICLTSAQGEKHKFQTLVKGERSPKFESLHLMESKIAVSQDKRLAFVSKNNEKDVLYMYDIRFRKIVLKKEFSNLVTLSSPAWSGDPNQVIFVGTSKAGYSDLYRYYITRDSLEALTDDIYIEKNPAWSLDGKFVIFSSDRGEFGKDGYLNLFMMNLETKDIIQFTRGKHNDTSPAWSLNGDLVIFTSDRNGSFDLFTLNPHLGETKQITSTIDGIFDAQFSSRQDKIYFSAFKDYNFHLYKMELPENTKVVDTLSSINKWNAWKPDRISTEFSQASVKYKKKFSFDIAQSVIAYDVVYGSVGGGQVAMTDMLGNHQYIFLLGHSARTKGDIWSGFNLGVTYVNRTHRLNYAFGAYHLNDEYYDDYYGYFYERQYGFLGFLSYPLSKFQRIEGSVFLRRSERDLYIIGNERKATLATSYVSFIKDTSLWGPVGPLDGVRLNLTLGSTTKFDKIRTYNRLILGDFRKYFRLSKRSCFAFRFTGFSSAGAEPQRLYLGGSWSLRGYDRRAFYGRKLVLVSDELRFPLIDDLSIKFSWGEMDFRAIGGALFFDLGNAWEKRFDHFYGSMGGGVRLNLDDIVVLRLDIAKKTDFTTISSDTEFDFFFGWDF
jgi:Tol biopolymer transport system component